MDGDGIYVDIRISRSAASPIDRIPSHGSADDPEYAFRPNLVPLVLVGGHDPRAKVSASRRADGGLIGADSDIDAGLDVEVGGIRCAAAVVVRSAMAPLMYQMDAW